MEGVISQIQISVIIPEEPPLDYLADWVASMKKAAPKIKKGLRKTIANFKAYAKKMSRPSRKTLQEWLNPNYRTKRGLSYKQVIIMAKAHERTGYNKFKKKIERAFKKMWGKETKYFLEAIDYRAYRACLRMSRLNLPFTGYGDQIRGVGPFAARWLSGDETVKYLIIDQDNLISGNPVMITRPNRAARFRNKFISRMRQAGSRIIKSGYRAIRTENNLTNKLVNKFIRPDIVPFITGGNSHIDFALIGNQLYLEIQVAEK